MSEVRGFIYDFPDDGGASFQWLLTRIPSHHLFHLELVPVGAFRLRGIDTATSMFLLLAVDGLLSADEQPPLNEGELFVPTALRPACELELEARASGPAIWTELEGVIGKQRAWSAFDQIWRASVLPRL